MQIYFPLAHSSHLICAYGSFSRYFVKESKIFSYLEIEQLFKSQEIKPCLLILHHLSVTERILQTTEWDVAAV